MESPLEKIERLRRELDEHNYNYYVLNAPTIDDRTFDEMMHELQGLEETFPQYFDPTVSIVPARTPKQSCKPLGRMPANFFKNSSCVRGGAPLF